MRNSSTFRRLAMASSGLAFCFCTASAFAQDGVTSLPDSPILRGLDATDGDASDIVVTARRREESAQDIPISLVVSSGEMLRDRSITQFSELQQQTPSFIVAPSLFGNTSTILSSRGLTLTDVRLNIDPVVGVYLDDVYLPRAVGLNASELLDLQRVEILAGPQGTLFGKNTSGGAVRIFTQLPTDQFEGFVRVRAGNHGDAAVSGVLNVPLSEAFAVRAVASVSGNDGLGRNQFDNSTTGEIDSRYFRLGALWRANEQLTVTLRGDYTRTKSTQAIYKGLQFLAAPTPGVGLGGPLATIEAALELNNLPSLAAFNALPLATRTSLIAAADTTLRSYAAGDRDNGNMDQPAPEEMIVKGASALIELELDEIFSVKSLSAVRYFRREGTGDLDGTPFSILQYPRLFAEETQYSTELQLAGSFLDGRIQTLVGAYYAEESGSETSDQVALRILGGATSTTFQNADISTRSIGLFTQNTLTIIDGLRATAGIRWSDDQRKLTSRNYSSASCLSLGQPLASIGGVQNCFRPMKVSFGPWSYTASLEYEAGKDVLLYATTRRGYRAGGLQESSGATTVAAADVAFGPFGPEIVEDFEVGIKSFLFDRRLRANVTFYHSNISGAIRSVPRTVPGSTASTVSTQNAAKERVNGVEWDFFLRPLPPIELALTGAWTDAKFVEYITPTGVDFSDLPVLNAPKWRYSLSAAYIADLPIGDWRTQLDYSWRSKVLAVEPGAFSPSYGILNARTSLKWDRHDLELALFAKNITNKRFNPSPIDVPSMGIITTGPYNPPRSLGLEITKNF